jgi:glycosyltransferase involved in cell wall biosynthesis
MGRQIVMNDPLVSILIPAYNAEEWIGDALRSALGQTWQSKEIIVVDDGSTDGTLEVASRFASDSVRIISQRNMGAAAARNTAFARSRGDYIQWLDADDLLGKDKIEKQIQMLDRGCSNRTLLSAAWGQFKYRHYKARFAPSALWCDLPPKEWLLRKMGQNLYMQTATWLVSRQLTELAGPWDTRLLGDDDNEYFCRVLLASDGVRFVGDAKVYYRTFGYGSLSDIGLSDSKMDAHWLSMQAHVRYLRSMEESETVRAACLRYLQAQLHHFHPQRPDIVDLAKRMANELAGELVRPPLPWHVAVMERMLTPKLAKHCELLLRNIARRLGRTFDKVLFDLSHWSTPGRAESIVSL